MWLCDQLDGSAGQIICCDLRCPGSGRGGGLVLPCLLACLEEASTGALWDPVLVVLPGWWPSSCCYSVTANFPMRVPFAATEPKRTVARRPMLSLEK